MQCCILKIQIKLKFLNQGDNRSTLTTNYNWNDRLIQVDIDEDNTLTALYDHSGIRTFKRLTTETEDSQHNPITYLSTTYYPNKLYEEQITETEGNPQSISTTKTRHITLGNQTQHHFLFFYVLCIYIKKHFKNQRDLHRLNQECYKKAKTAQSGHSIFNQKI